MIVGNFSPAPIEFPIVGLASLIAALTNSDGTPYIITNAVTLTAEFRRTPDVPAALIAKSSGTPGQIIALDSDGYIYIPFTDPDKLILSAGTVYSLLVQAINVSDGSVALVNTFFCIPLNQYFQFSKPEDVPMALSTAFLNTVAITDYVGGSGYLDGISTLVQPVGCWITFTRAGAQPEEWELVVWTDASMNTDPGNLQQPLDFNASTNAKVWKRRS